MPLVAALAILLSGCTAPPAEITQAQAIAEGASPLREFAVPKSSVPAKYYDQRVAWHACGVDECGVIAAPRDWANPRGAAISLALIEHKATGAPMGTLVVDPGGPGGSGITWVGRDFPAVVDSSVAARYNVVGFDPRGVGQSTPVSCLSTAELDKYIFAPTVGAIGSDAWIDDQRRRAATIADGCDAESGSILDDVDTVSVAHDLDLIRSALGESKLDYFGASWGTYLGTIYAGLYPNNTRRIVLDGAYDPWSTANKDGIAQAVGFEGDLDVYLTACLKGRIKAVGNATCPFSGSFEKAQRAVHDLLTSADRSPIAGPAGLSLDGAVLSKAIIEALYSPKYWPDLTKMFIQLHHWVTTEAMRFVGARYGLDASGVPVNNFEAAFIADRCIEAGTELNIIRDESQLTLLEDKAPVLGPYDSYNDLTCSEWHYGPVPFPVPVHAPTASPMLVIGTTGDPATPYGEAEDLARQLKTSRLVTFHGEGHTAYDKGNACIDRTVDRYLLSGAVPAKDPQCR
jgi:pimeloyl-ACP methyl ester carboxylesterase